MYIGIGLAVLIFVTLCLLQICLKDGLPCLRCLRKNEFTMDDDEPAEPFVSQQTGKSNLKPTGSMYEEKQITGRVHFNEPTQSRSTRQQQ